MSGRFGEVYQFKKIAVEKFNQKQNAIISLAEEDGVKVEFAEGSKIYALLKDGTQREEEFRGVYLGDGKIILSSDGESYEHEIFHHYEAIHKDAALQFSEIVQQQIKMGDPRVMADLLRDHLDFSGKELQAYVATFENKYFEGGVDLFDRAQMDLFEEELFAYISGDIHEGKNDAQLAPMFRDYAAVKTAWEALIRKYWKG